MTPPDATLMDLAAENAALRELLEVYEGTSVEQAKKLGHALHELGESARRLLEAEREASRLARQQAKQLERELEIAAQIQTSILPRSYQVAGFDVAAAMVPAERVGGDYYDVIPTGDGCWLAIGDVSGHGLTAGLIMLMTQCAVGAVVRREPNIAPADALDTVNEVLVENIRHRLRTDEHVTLTLLRLDAAGHLRLAGAHEDLLIFRHATGKIEHIETPGTWVGIRSGLRDVLVESAFELDVGDVLVLYSDGITEARDSTTRELFGGPRLADTLLESAAKPSSEICAEIFRRVDQWASRADDDRTAVVIRRAIM